MFHCGTLHLTSASGGLESGCQQLSLIGGIHIKFGLIILPTICLRCRGTKPLVLNQYLICTRVRVWGSQAYQLLDGRNGAYLLRKEDNLRYLSNLSILG